MESPERSIVHMAPKHGRLQVEGRRGHTQAVLGDPGAQAEGGGRDDQARSLPLLDDLVKPAHVGKDGPLDDAVETPPAMPEARVGHHGLGLPAGSKTDEFEAALPHEALEYLVGGKGDPVPAGLQRLPQAEHGVHVAGAADRCQKNAQGHT